MKKIFKSEEGKQEVLKRYQEILSSWPVENKQYKVDTSFGSTFVIESGSNDNPPLILLHGSVSNSFCWYSDVITFSKTHHVYAIDLIGEAGFSDPNRPTYESGDYSSWLDETFKSLSLKTCSIVGLSLGGWMALDFATTYPDKVEQLVLLCPGGLAKTKSSFLWKNLFLSLLGKWGKKQAMKLVYNDATPSVSTSDMKSALEFTQLISKHFNPRLEKLPVFDGVSLSKLTMPIQVIFGERDNLIPAQKSINHLKRFTSQTNDTLLPNTGHVVVNQSSRILEFLESNKLKPSK
ncbi:MAG: alpha/beta hydrolase [Firmicutes bacterium]|nr:alpha/beta hydrolase [Bacillota bacterium]